MHRSSTEFEDFSKMVSIISTEAVSSMKQNKRNCITNEILLANGFLTL